MTAAFLTTALFVQSVLAAPPGFTQPTTVGTPSARRSTGAAEQNSGNLVFYGGFDGTATLSTYLALDPGSGLWAAGLAAPPARERHALAYDPVHDLTVVFGGASGLTVFNTVIIFNGAGQFSQSTTAGGPSARMDSTMAWAPSLNAFVVFGGRTSVFANNHVGDLWTLDVADGGATWTSIPSSGGPSARGAACSAWDPVRNQLVLFGGEANNDQADTWTWTRTGGWVSVTPTGSIPPARSFCEAAWEPNLQQLVVYGGQSTNPIGGLYSFDPVTRVWTQWNLTPNPGNLSDAAAVYSSRYGGILLFGGRTAGTTYTNAVWLLKFNRPPTADAGPALSVGEATLVQLVGSGTDPDGDALTLTWSQVSGPAVTLTPGTPGRASFTSPSVLTATPMSFLLTVSDNASQATSQLAVTVNDTIDEPPVVDAGPDQMVASGAPVTLNGSASDPNGDPLVFAWAQTAGPPVVLTSLSSPTTSFTAPVVGMNTVVTLRLTVSDGRGGAPSDAVDITVLGGSNVSDGGADAGTDGGADAGVDAGLDAGADAGLGDAGLGADGGTGDDGGSADASVVSDAGVTDAGTDGGADTDGGAGADGGAAEDAGGIDSGLLADAGLDDAGAGHDGGADAGTGRHELTVGCGCSSFDGVTLLVAALLLGRRRLRAR
ncbi:MAG: hypothetical protein U0228_04840 [Myxococcaceae bacterium]